MIPGLSLTEGGQSATGALIDHILSSHPAFARVEAEAKKKGESVYQRLNARLDELSKKAGCAFPAELTRDFHIQPDFHGNRSPRANPTLQGDYLRAWPIGHCRRSGD